LKTFIYLQAILIFGYCSKSNNNLSAQTIIYETQLPKKINETSGLEFFNQNFITHNDSGGKPKLYKFNQMGNILEECTIEGAVNNDWEDIAQDENYLYISDSGNNKGKRQNLNILILDPINNFKKVGNIAFNYRNQQNFEKRNKHPFDAEALVATPNELILFSKNRATHTTELYSIPKTPGNYSLSPKKSFDVQSLITGGDYKDSIKLIALVGYSGSGRQFLYTLSSFDMENLNRAEMKTFKLPLDGKQIEAIKIIDQNTFWVTSEDEGIGYPMLYKIQL
jgi:hypothetical protein